MTTTSGMPRILSSDSFRGLHRDASLGSFAELELIAGLERTGSIGSLSRYVVDTSPRHQHQPPMISPSSSIPPSTSFPAQLSSYPDLARNPSNTSLFHKDIEVLLASSNAPESTSARPPQLISSSSYLNFVGLLERNPSSLQLFAPDNSTEAGGRGLVWNDSMNDLITTLNSRLQSSGNIANLVENNAGGQLPEAGANEETSSDREMLLATEKNEEKSSGDGRETQIQSDDVKGRVTKKRPRKRHQQALNRLRRQLEVVRSRASVVAQLSEVIAAESKYLSSISQRLKKENEFFRSTLVQSGQRGIESQLNGNGLTQTDALRPVSVDGNSLNIPNQSTDQARQILQACPPMYMNMNPYAVPSAVAPFSMGAAAPGGSYVNDLSAQFASTNAAAAQMPWVYQDIISGYDMSGMNHRVSAANTKLEDKPKATKNASARDEQ
uniref:Uncharacterized protein n=1 Tax=Timspurckia oligopyrenoides TaxID=708627 RepID=A0A7S0ZE51_9RHOD|mmetsp:Transcript_1732/g.3074  ORF Transcript_1732/g.3074 Transcript_1732/m.3074 type:complete len:439 (+) Transcript_1732:60-1376(+)